MELSWVCPRNRASGKRDAKEDIAFIDDVVQGVPTLHQSIMDFISGGYLCLQSDLPLSLEYHGLGAAANYTSVTVVDESNSPCPS